MDLEVIMSFVILLTCSFGWWFLWFKLFKKIGKDWTWAFVMFVPVVNWGALIWFIVSGWPNRPRPGDDGDYKQTGKML